VTVRLRSLRAECRGRIEHPDGCDLEGTGPDTDMPRFFSSGGAIVRG